LLKRPSEEIFLIDELEDDVQPEEVPVPPRKAVPDSAAKPDSAKKD
jgi:hypothetical protein